MPLEKEESSGIGTKTINITCRPRVEVTADAPRAYFGKYIQ